MMDDDLGCVAADAGQSGSEARGISIEPEPPIPFGDTCTAQDYVELEPQLADLAAFTISPNEFTDCPIPTEERLVPGSSQLLDTQSDRASPVASTYTLIKSDEFTNRYYYQSCEDQDMIFDLRARMANVQIPSYAYPKLTIDEDRKEIFRMPQSIPHMILATPGHTLYQQIPNKSDSYSTMVVAYHTPSSIAKQYPKSKANQLMKDLHDKICERDPTEPNSFMFQHKSLRPNNRSPKSSKNIDGSRKTVDGSFNLTISKVEEGVGVVAPAATTTDANVQSWIRDLTDIGSRLSAETSRISRRRRDHVIACADYELHNTIRPGNGEGLFHLIQMNVLTKDVSLEDGIGKESGTMHVDGNDCKLHPTMMACVTKIPTAQPGLGGHRGIFVLAQYGIIIEILEDLVIVWFTGVGVHGGSRTYATREQWEAIIKEELEKIWGVPGMPEGFVQFRIVLVFYSKELITRRNGYLNLCQPSQYGHVSQGGAAQATKYNIFANHGSYLWSSALVRHTWLSREIAMSMYNMCLQNPDAVPPNPNDILRTMRFIDENQMIRYPTMFRDDMNPSVDPVGYKRWRAWILFRRMVASMFLVPFSRASLRQKLHGKGRPGDLNFETIGDFDLDSEDTPIAGITKIISSVAVTRNDKRYLILELEVKGKSAPLEVLAGDWMTESHLEMLKKHLIQKMKDKIPQPRAASPVISGRLRRKNKLASIQEASHQLLDIAIQKPPDKIDQMLLSTLENDFGNPDINNDIFLPDADVENKQTTMSEETIRNNPTSTAVNQDMLSSSEDEDEAQSVPRKRNRRCISSSSDEEAEKTQPSGKKSYTQKSRVALSSSEESYVQAVLKKGFDTSLLTLWLMAGWSNGDIKKQGSHFRSEAFHLRTALNTTNTLNDKRRSTLLPSALGFSRMLASAVYLRQDSAEQPATDGCQLPYDLVVQNHLTELWMGQLTIDASVSRELHVSQDHEHVHNRVFFREQCYINQRVLHFILHESNSLVLAMLHLYQKGSTERLSNTFPSYSLVFLEIVQQFKTWSSLDATSRKPIEINIDMLGRWSKFASDRKSDTKISVPPLNVKILHWKKPLQQQSLTQLQILFEECFIGLLLVNGLAPNKRHITQQSLFLDLPQLRKANRWEWYQTHRSTIFLEGALAELLVDTFHGEAILSTNFAHKFVTSGVTLFRHAIPKECKNSARVMYRVLQTGYETLLDHLIRWHATTVEPHVSTGDHLAALSHYLDYARCVMEGGRSVKLKDFGPPIHKTYLGPIERKAMHANSPLSRLPWVEKFSKTDILQDGKEDVHWLPLAVILRESLRRARGIRKDVRFADCQTFPPRVAYSRENPSADVDQIVQWILNGLDVDRRHVYDPDHTEPSRHLSRRVQLLHGILPRKLLKTNNGFSTFLVCFLSGQGDGTKQFLHTSPVIYSSALEIDLKVDRFIDAHPGVDIDNMSIWGQPNSHLRFSGQDSNTRPSVRMSKCFSPTTHNRWKQFQDRHHDSPATFTETQQFLEDLRITGLGGLTSLHATNFLLDTGFAKSASVIEMGHIISRTDLGGTQGLQHMGLVAPPGDDRYNAAALAVVVCHLEEHMSAEDKVLLGFIDSTSCAENYCCKIQKFVHRCYKMNGVQAFLDMCPKLATVATHGTVSAAEPDLFPFPLTTTEDTWSRALGLVNSSRSTTSHIPENIELEAVAQMLVCPDLEMAEVKILAVEEEDKDEEDSMEE